MRERWTEEIARAWHAGERRAAARPASHLRSRLHRADLDGGRLMANMVQAIRMALHYGEENLGVTDIFGEDVGPPLGGVFTATQGLKTAWNSPLDERGIIGAAMGLALAGGRPSPRSSSATTASTPSTCSSWRATALGVERAMELPDGHDDAGRLAASAAASTTRTRSTRRRPTSRAGRSSCRPRRSTRTG